jgi:hypothetical protein
MVGTGLTFAAGVGALAATVALVGVLAGELTGRQLLQVVGKLSVVSFLVGVLFAGALAVTARGRTFDRLSLRYVTGVGAGGGVLYFLLIATNAWNVWSPMAALGNLALLAAIGGGSAAAALLLARRAGRALAAGGDSRRIGEGGIKVAVAGRDVDRVRRD